MSDDRPSLLIAGCGDLGIRLAERVPGWQVHGLRRNVARLPGTIMPEAGDLNRPETLARLDRYWDAVIYTATPSGRGVEGYRSAYVDGLARLLDRVETPRLIAVSSTAVYGQDGGEWVDEDSPTEPSAFNGEILLEYEQLARGAGGTALRFSGIYGPGRDFLIRKVRAGGVECRREPAVWTNRIHAEDCAAALAHLLALDQLPPVLIGSDQRPAPRWQVLSWLAEQLGADPPVEVADGEAGRKISQGKRVSAARLFATGFALQYPDYRAGYEELLRCG
ncbi:MAG: SDR family NAD(P)-dependent oxidoreductase [Wenzhouxiangellaceae bacterium]|nr:SDR family NAD(P)-dependent oxidoreductase [Wenzhouxiangellaceae bacterium]